MNKQVASTMVVTATVVAIATTLLTKADESLAQVPVTTSANEAVVVSVDAAGGGQFVVVVDTAQQVMGSYHVAADSGNITLRSVRKFRWDMQMDEFNGAEPRPQDVRAMLDERR